SRLFAGGDVRDAAPPVEHRGDVGAAVPPHGGPHGVPDRRAPSRAGDRRPRAPHRAPRARARGVTGRLAGPLGPDLRGGVTTFMVMAYIIFVNPAILSFAGIPGLAGKGPSFAAAQAATCLVAGVMTIAMGLVTNYPLAVASGMGLNAVVAFQLVAGAGLTWQGAMGVVVLEGVLITILVLTGLREAIMNAIPLSLKRAIGVGIGLFILFIGLVSGGVVKAGPPGVPLTLGDLGAPAVLVTLVGLLLTLWLHVRGVSG